MFCWWRFINTKTTSTKLIICFGRHWWAHLGSSHLASPSKRHVKFKWLTSLWSHAFNSSPYLGRRVVIYQLPPCLFSQAVYLPRRSWTSSINLISELIVLWLWLYPPSLISFSLANFKSVVNSIKLLCRKSSFPQN